MGIAYKSSEVTHISLLNSLYIHSNRTEQNKRNKKSDQLTYSEWIHLTQAFCFCSSRDMAFANQCCGSSSHLTPHDSSDAALYTSDPQYKTQARLYLFTDRTHRPLTDLHHANKNLAADSHPDPGDQHEGNGRTASRSMQSHMVRYLLPGGFWVHILEKSFQLLSMCHSYYSVRKCGWVISIVKW